MHTNEVLEKGLNKFPEKCTGLGRGHMVWGRWLAGTESSSSRSALPSLPTSLFPDCLFFLSFLSLHILEEASFVLHCFIFIMSYHVVNQKPGSSLILEINRLLCVSKKTPFILPLVVITNMSKASIVYYSQKIIKKLKLFEDHILMGLII